MDLALNNLQRLLCHKTKPTKPSFVEKVLNEGRACEKGIVGEGLGENRLLQSELYLFH